MNLFAYANKHLSVVSCIPVYLHVLLFAHFDSKRPWGGCVSIDQNVQL